MLGDTEFPVLKARVSEQLVGNMLSCDGKNLVLSMIMLPFSDRATFVLFWSSRTTTFVLKKCLYRINM